MMQNKKTLLALVALVAVIAVFLTVFLLTRPKTDPGAKAFTVVVIHKDGSEKTFHLRTDELYLGPALVSKELIVMDEAQAGMFSTVDGEKADWSVDQSYWALYVGSSYASLGINDTPVNDGDSFRLVYTVG